MVETALNVPFDSTEVKEIAVAEFRKRLDGLSPLSGGKEYAAFSIDFEVKIRLRRAGEQPHEAKETLAWGKVEKGEQWDGNVVDPSNPERAVGESFDIASTFDSKDPNEERIARGMPLTVESGDGRGGKVRRKVKVKG